MSEPTVLNAFRHAAPLRGVLRLSVRAALLSLASAGALSAAEWQTLFNGRDLTGWTGDPRLWSVKDGAIVGATDQGDHKINSNTFLVWKGGEPADFELEYKCREDGNNSGVQYRSHYVDPSTWRMGGYQMDIHPKQEYLGQLYEETTDRGIACLRGQKVTLNDHPQVTGTLPIEQVDVTQWNDYRIVCRGNVLQHYVNGKLAAEITDVNEKKRALKGLIGLQLHAGPSMKAEFKDLRLKLIEDGPGAKTAIVTPAPPLNWIWLGPQAGQQQTVYFRREFQLPADVTSAFLISTCDNRHKVWLNGRELGSSNDWNTGMAHDVTALIRKDGRNVIAIEGYNEDGVGGLAVRFSVTLKDKSHQQIVSDGQWATSLTAPGNWQDESYDDKGWQPATVLGPMGMGPWGDVIGEGDTGANTPEDMTSSYKLLPGFKLERLYKVPSAQGSWVAMTPDDKGHFYCADQYGKIMLVTPPSTPDGDTVVEPTEIPIGGAHGLLWFQDALYVTVNESEDQGGVWRVTDSNGDGKPDKAVHIKAMHGRGEHGPHALVASPDGKWIYTVAGNFTDLPEMDSTLPIRNWAEDQLLPRRPDPNGHAADRMAPGGWIARFRPDGKDWQLFAMGMRNTYDIAFNENGDLFGYDSDMEWDFGMPWYRPTRICQIVPGADFGWRNGTGPFPPYYEDSMYPQLEMGPGSPTGMVSGKGAKFPAKYQKAIFAMDWTYATIHALLLTPEGRGYKATQEELLAGVGLPLTDASIGQDGALYFLTGGRRISSALWRITYTGSEPTEPVAYKSKNLELAGTADAWEGMGSPDRLTRYQSRIALEAEGPAAFSARLAKESQPWTIISASIGLARCGSAADRANILTALDRVDWSKLDKQQKLSWLRAAGLVFARYGEPNEAERAKAVAKIDASFPAADTELDRELCRMLCYLQAPGIVGRTLSLMDTAGPTPPPDWLAVAKRNPTYGGDVERMMANQPPAQVIHYINCLRVVKGPWKVEDRKRFFGWFDQLEEKSGGNSYVGFIKDLRKQALAICTPEEREWILKLPKAGMPNAFANLPQPKGPGRNWTIEEIEKVAATGLAGRDRENGHKMFQASLCALCHRIGTEGGAVGPDLSTLGGRFTVHDVAEAIVDPSKTISDQFAFDIFTKTDGSQLMGRLIEEKDGKAVIASNPFDFSNTIEVPRSEIRETRRSPISPMPPSLLGRLNEDELKDLLAYLLAK